jgi:alpha-glucosidase
VRVVWWRDAVVYQVYPRSFQDSDGDGVGDLPGLASRLEHLAWLGVDALWLSPIHPSPLADMGYDVSDYTSVDPVFGTLADFDALVRAARSHGLRVLLDFVPCHTSIEHPWFREHPDWYIWADRPNNWRAAFGGSAWTRLGERWYLHSFYPEQPDLDWRNPEVVAAMQDVLRLWLGRGAAGYRVDAIDRLLKDPELRDDPPATESFGLPVPDHSAHLAPERSRNAPDIGDALRSIRAAAGQAFLVGEVYLPSSRWGPYLEHLDRAFAFELLHSDWHAGALRDVLADAGRRGAAAWVLSNHDFGHLSTRFGAENARAATMLLLTLPGVAFLYQGDEIGQLDGPPEESRHDRAGRDGYRRPMQWDGSPAGGFSAGVPWLPAVDPGRRNVESQREDPRSTLHLVRELIALRRELGDAFELRPSAPGVLAYRRGGHTVALNSTGERLPEPRGLGPTVLATAEPAREGGELLPHAGVVALG